MLLAADRRQPRPLARRGALRATLLHLARAPGVPNGSVPGRRGDAMRELERLTRELGRDLGRCAGDFEMLRPGDRVMVCLSGGKDSYTMLHLLERLRQRAPFQF